MYGVIVDFFFINILGSRVFTFLFWKNTLQERVLSSIVDIHHGGTNMLAVFLMRISKNRPKDKYNTNMVVL